MGEKHQISNPVGSKMKPVVKSPTIKQQVFPTLHTDAHDRFDDISMHHKPHFPQDPKCFQALSQQHGAIRRGAFRHGAHGDARLRQQEDRGGAWCAGCRQRSAGCRGCARMATWRRAFLGDHVLRRLGVCAMFSLHVSSHISRRVICVSPQRP